MLNINIYYEFVEYLAISFLQSINKIFSNSFIGYPINMHFFNILLCFYRTSYKTSIIRNEKIEKEYSIFKN